MSGIVEIAKALADPGRVRALAALQESELCVCQLIELLGLAPSTVSKHMQVLRQAGLVTSRKQGRWIYYRAPGRGAAARRALAWILREAEAEPWFHRDRARLREILATDPEELCRMQHRPCTEEDHEGARQEEKEDEPV